MQLSTLLISLMASLAIAVPTNTGGGGDGGGGDDGGDNGGGGGGGDGGSSPYVACTSTLYSQANCCATDVVGVLDLTCNIVAPAPTSADNFKDVCAETGLFAKCCTLNAVELGVICNNPVGL